ncbi:hypothetical protein KIW84_014355 [Lathyrus oleraceus]|uniref:Uncharacterized protein n=1 Tax=Pisum sativum TaxID=3888 RepID=A0A9D5BMI7_PEA|nr:hypothetical protein KIW84_014355 [Pisum sativum]
MQTRKALDKIRQRFLWGGSEEKSKIHWVRWELVCIDKGHGGLGFMNYNIGDGNQTRFWTNKWCGGSTLAEMGNGKLVYFKVELGGLWDPGSGCRINKYQAKRDGDFDCPKFSYCKYCGFSGLWKESSIALCHRRSSG